MTGEAPESPAAAEDQVVRFSVALPTDQVDRAAHFLSAGAIAKVAVALEEAGVSACHVTDHPFPPADFPASGGHHSLDPFAVLSVVTTVTERLLLHTNVLIPAYRNPFLAAKSVATLDVLSGGRVILGVAAGYLEQEFAALGATFDKRGERLENDLVAMRRAWTGGPVHLEGPGWKADGNAMLPTPSPGLRLWMGGNSRAAMRRAVRVADGWAPFPASRRTATAVRTDAIVSPEDLDARLRELDELVASSDRQAPFDVCMASFTHHQFARTFDPPALLDEAAALADIGVTWLTVRLPAPDPTTLRRNIDRLGAEVIDRLDRAWPVTERGLRRP